ncbi:uncharacterized protein TRUGW13939_04100 [Talaromyces rugulosus]|uniref:Sulfatase N-terminal domain-containing protein n=1 Tax=Talaromyces rugulosus TaxID=121627 RepID=A0A7H8QSS1_TALRU|nr:uncharacterized protein TRUGW13939_04100 [Talaromyces rugulosus]QKX56992.1 hypothetical protein TRUGW13939_04100 [Talaromyces rugulosus]
MASPSRPNIIFILADDHASKAISAYNTGINSTPNIDRLATESMKFNHCYVTNSICTPSRAVILTNTRNHVNGVMTLDGKINKHLPNVAKALRSGGYATGMVGKWHLGEGHAHEPTGFDYWSILPGQGDYWDPKFIESSGTHPEKGYVTDIITDKSLKWIDSILERLAPSNDEKQPFFLMSHHKAPHRSWECHDRHKYLYSEPIRVPETFGDDYRNRAKAAKVAKMRVAEDLTYQDLGLVQPDGSDSVGQRVHQEGSNVQRKVPAPDDVSSMRLTDKDTGQVFTFRTPGELAEFKLQRYMQRYLRTIQSIDDGVGTMLSYFEEKELRFMYEESFQMPFLIRYPALIAPGTVCYSIVCNVDFAPTFLSLAGGLRIPTYMQGVSSLPLLRSRGEAPRDWQQVAYHRYWMSNDEIHNAMAHYGVRDQRYKLIYWYNDDLGVEGARPATTVTDKEWELFDCDEDPLELFNVYFEAKCQDVVRHMTRLLEDKMEEIGDDPVHRKTEGAAKGRWRL